MKSFHLRVSLKGRSSIFFDATKTRKMDVWGWLALTYVHNLPQEDTSGLGQFCLDKGGGDPTKAAEVMAEEFDNF